MFRGLPSSLACKKTLELEKIGEFSSFKMSEKIAQKSAKRI